jgi:hypothetical protein
VPVRTNCHRVVTNASHFCNMCVVRLTIIWKGDYYMTHKGIIVTASVMILAVCPAAYAISCLSVVPGMGCLSLFDFNNGYKTGHPNPYFEGCNGSTPCAISGNLGDYTNTEYWVFATNAAGELVLMPGYPQPCGAGASNETQAVQMCQNECVTAVMKAGDGVTSGAPQNGCLPGKPSSP